MENNFQSNNTPSITTWQVIVIVIGYFLAMSQLADIMEWIKCY